MKFFIPAYQDTFKMFDRNGDGKITAEEIKEGKIE